MTIGIHEARRALYKSAQAAPLFTNAFSSFVSRASAPLATSAAKTVPLAGDAVARMSKGMTQLAEQAKTLPTPKLTPPNPMMPGTKNIGKPPKPVLDKPPSNPMKPMQKTIGKPPNTPAPSPNQASKPVQVQKTSSIAQVREWARAFVPPQR